MSISEHPAPSKSRRRKRVLHRGRTREKISRALHDEHAGTGMAIADLLSLRPVEIYRRLVRQMGRRGMRDSEIPSLTTCDRHLRAISAACKIPARFARFEEFEEFEATAPTAKHRQ